MISIVGAHPKHTPINRVMISWSLVSTNGEIYSLDALYAQAAQATRAGSRGFFFATQHFPIDLSRAAHAVYWFSYYTRGLASQADLDAWACLVDSGLRGRLARHPVLDVFLDTVDQRAIPHHLPMELIEGARMDLDHQNYASFSQLRARSQRIGGVVSLMMMHVVGFRDPAGDYMADLGIAIELTTLLRDTAAHLERGRIYLPVDEMDAAGYSAADLENHVRNEAFHALMKVQTERIHGLYQHGEPGLALLDSRGRFAVKVAFDLYRQTLRHIEGSGFDVFRRRAGVPAVEAAWIAARSMAGPITRRLWKVMSA
jgi:phytoene synthase